MGTIIALLAGVWLFGAAVRYLREDEERERLRAVRGAQAQAIAASASCDAANDLDGVRMVKERG